MAGATDVPFCSRTAMRERSVDGGHGSFDEVTSRSVDVRCEHRPPLGASGGGGGDLLDLVVGDAEGQQARAGAGDDGGDAVGRAATPAGPRSPASPARAGPGGAARASPRAAAPDGG